MLMMTIMKKLETERQLTNYHHPLIVILNCFIVIDNTAVPRPVPAECRDPIKMRVVDLRKALENQGLVSTGIKSALMTRWVSYTQGQTVGNALAKALSVKNEAAAAKEAAKQAAEQAKIKEAKIKVCTWRGVFTRAHDIWVKVTLT